MTARMVILSGPQQGQTLLIPAVEIVVGGDPETGILLEPGSEARSIHAGATLRCADDGWQIEPLGEASVWVNEDALTTQTALLAGDIVRLSHQGPDFIFEVDAVADITAALPVSDELAPPTQPASAQPPTPPAMPAPAGLPALRGDRNGLPSIGPILPQQGGTWADHLCRPTTGE